MILNSYALLISFIGLLRLLLGVLILSLAISTLYCWHTKEKEFRSTIENRGYLVFLLTFLLLGLNLTSWPLLYLLLQSYVPEWPGVMCIYGVMQVGKGSLGSSRFLPDLLCLLQLTKPALIFLGGAWFVVYWLNRQTRTAPLLNRLFVVLLPLGLVAVVDSTAELAYVTIPKKEVFPPSGCCVSPAARAESTASPVEGVLDRSTQWQLYGAYYTINLGLILALHLFCRAGVPLRSLGMALLLIAGAIVAMVSGLFLVEVAAPTLLKLPYHRCPYDLIPQIPEAVVAVMLFLGGTFFLSWSGVAWWLGESPETKPFRLATTRNLLRLSLCGFMSSLSMLSLELILP